MKHRLNKLFLPFAATALLFTSCGGDDTGGTPSEGTLTTDAAELFIGADAGNTSFTVSASGNWEITGYPEWCSSVKPRQGGKGDTKVTVQGKFYDGSEDRSGNIVIAYNGKSLSLPLTQYQKGQILLEETSCEVAKEGKTITVKVRSNVDCEISFIPDDGWIRQKTVRSMTETSYSFEILPNMGADREADIVFTDRDSDLSESLHVVQAGEPLAQERAVLTQLFEATGGANWTSSEGWGTDAPLAEWYGVEVGSDGRVTALRLPDNNLTGTLSGKLGDLSNLQALVLSGNKLSGTFPASLRELAGWASMDPATDIYPQAEGYGFMLADGEVTVRRTATRGKGINVVILGDGFTQENQELVLGKGFDALADDAVKHLFDVEPYKSYADYFNVYSVAAVSNVSRVTSKVRDTAFKSYFEAAMGVSMRTDENLVFTYAAKAPIDNDFASTLIILIAYSERFGGTTMAWDDGRAISVCSSCTNPVNAHETFDRIIRHESGGHAFGKLDEEYMTSTEAPPASYAETLKARHAKGMSLNIDTTDDLTQVVWKHFIGLEGYEAVGAYEGGGNYKEGVWRPESGSCMLDNRAYFNAPSREAIVRRIKQLAGEEYSFEEFQRLDVEKTQTAALRTTRSAAEVFTPLGRTLYMDEIR